jgi:SAM-dependent methyltransferase
VVFEPGPAGRIVEDGVAVGEVVRWDPPSRVVFEWRPPEWQSQEATNLELRLESAGAGTRVVMEYGALPAPFADGSESAAWFAGDVAARLLRAFTPGALGDWLTDRLARRPFGPQARATYADPLYHYPNFRVLLAELALTSDDYLLEVGCGGGALLKQALESGCRAAAIDHSSDMVRVAREANRRAIEEGRLVVLHGDAHDLPFPDATFTRAVMTGVLGFLADPVRALGEIRRTLRPGGVFAGLGSDPELKGTPAAPEPMASRLRFYDDDGLAALGRAAGFDHAAVLRRDLSRFARDAGVPQEHLALFEGDARFLVARRDGPASRR